MNTPIYLLYLFIFFKLKLLYLKFSNKTLDFTVEERSVVKQPSMNFASI